MARLQRKKTQRAGKKKKQNAVETTSLKVRKEGAVKKTPFLTGAVKDNKKKISPVKSKALTRAKAEPGKLKSYIDKGVQFLREVKVELKKVVWPTRKQTLGSTVVVLILVMIISLFLGVVDLGLSGLIRVVLK